MTYCLHVCNCLHHTQGGEHIRPCCYECEMCGQNIPPGRKNAHFRMCHEEED